MGASKRKQEVNGHVKRYVDAVFAERFHKEGFLSPENRSICWYRQKNSELINSLFFICSWNIFPLMVDLCYGIHPLFTEPFFTRNAYKSRTVGNELYRYQPFCKEGSLPQTFSIFSDDIWVQAPLYGTRGLYTFEEVILPKMEQIETIEDCYMLHKEWYDPSTPVDMDKDYYSMQLEFIDEAIYLDDYELYPICLKRLDERIAAYTKSCERYPNKKEYRRRLEGYTTQKKVILENGRADYLAILEKRKEKNIATLKKKYGLIFD